jgi:hypothetical protein
LSIPEHPTAYIIVITAFFMVVGSIIQWTFLLMLRKNHSNLWYAMGRPTIWTDQSLFSTWPTIKFIQQKRYLNHEFGSVKFCGFFHFPLVLFYWATALSLAMFFVAIFVFGWPEQWR